MKESVSIAIKISYNILKLGTAFYLGYTAGMTATNSTSKELHAAINIKESNLERSVLDYD